MIYTLKNEFLTVKIAARGAEILSVRSGDGVEYMWQGDSRYWDGTAPWLFPICSKLEGDVYTYGGKQYEMFCHGFAYTSEFTAHEVSDTALTMRLQANGETRKVYPFDFLLEISYRLEGNQLSCTMSVTNRDAAVMPVAVGGHPGFCVPLGGDGSFDDWKLVFSEPCTPRAVVFTENVLDSGKRIPYPLQNETTFPLSRELFVIDGTFFCDMAPAVTLCSDRSERAVTVRYGKIPYLGIWSEANGGDFVCVEPWYGMASLEGVSALEEKSDMLHLNAGEQHVMQMDIIFH